MINLAIMIERQQAKQIKKLIKHFPAVGIVGARQVGKTTLVKGLEPFLDKPCVYFDLESPRVMAQLKDNPEWFLSQYQDKTVIIDEVQLMLELFPLLRSLIDENRVAGRFILLGSASPTFLAKSSETLAGRIAYIELPPLHFSEVISEEIDLKKHWFRGGFPDALLAPDDDIWALWQENFIRTYITRDLVSLGITINQSSLYNLLQMLTGVHGSVIIYSDLANSLNINYKLITQTIDVLEQAFLIRRLQPWAVSKRVVKSPKLYYRDSGNLHHLSNVFDYDLLIRNKLIGHSWEGYVIEQVCNALHHSVKPYFYRTTNQAEMDLVLVKGITPLVSIEIKLSSANSLTRGSTEALNDLKTEHNFIITTEGGNYFIRPEWKVCNVLEVLKNLGELGFLSNNISP
jgi:uncharacterized protein